MFDLPPDNPFTAAVNFLAWAKLVELAFLLVSIAILVRVWYVKRDARVSLVETRKLAESSHRLHEASYRLLLFMKEWAELGKTAREDATRSAVQFETKLEQRTQEVKESVEAVPDKVVEKIKDAAAADSGRLPTAPVQLPAQS